MPARCASSGRCRVKLRRRRSIDLARVVHLQHQLVGEPVAEEVEADGDEERNRHALLATQEVADAQEEGGQGGQKQRRAEVVHGRKDGSELWRIKVPGGIMAA